MYLYIDVASDRAIACSTAASRKHLLYDFLAVSGFAVMGLAVALGMAFAFPSALELTPLLVLFS